MSSPAKSPSPNCSSECTEDISALSEKKIDEANKEEVEKDTQEKIQEDTREDLGHAEQRNKKIKVMNESTDEETAAETVSDDISSLVGVDVTCSHPVVVKNLCSHCGEAVKESESSVAFEYIQKDLRLKPSAIERLRKESMKYLLKDEKLILVLDLDHTLVNSIYTDHLTEEEEYLLDEVMKKEDLFKLSRYDDMLTKLRPFVYTFLEEASNMFEMYIYTMGDRVYADEIVGLLDPAGVYFPTRVICRYDNTIWNQKGLDIVLRPENMVIILDDTENVWEKNKENLILMQRYHYFVHSAREHGSYISSVTESNTDESESDGVLANILVVLRRAHELFFDTKDETELAMRDMRQILPLIKREILWDCPILLSEELSNFNTVWKLAEDMGARCFSDVDDSVTHVVATASTTMMAEWARDNNKILVTPRWIEMAHYFWKWPKEEDFTVL